MIHKSIVCLFIYVNVKYEVTNTFNYHNKMNNHINHYMNIMCDINNNKK